MPYIIYVKKGIGLKKILICLLLMMLIGQDVHSGKYNTHKDKYSKKTGQIKQCQNAHLKSNNVVSVFLIIFLSLPIFNSLINTSMSSTRIESSNSFNINSFPSYAP